MCLPYLAVSFPYIVLERESGQKREEIKSERSGVLVYLKLPSLYSGNCAGKGVSAWSVRACCLWWLV